MATVYYPINQEGIAGQWPPATFQLLSTLLLFRTHATIKVHCILRRIAHYSATLFLYVHLKSLRRRAECLVAVLHVMGLQSSMPGTCAV